MKITFIGSVMDYANVLTEYAYLLNKHSDIECKVVCHRPHPFNYEKKHDYDLCNVISKQDRSKLTQFIQESEFVIFGEENTWNYENYHALEIIKNFSGIDLINSNKKLCILHVGSVYRRHHVFFNNHPLRGKLYKSLYGIDLYRLSPKTDKDKPFHMYQYFDFEYNKFILDFENKTKDKPWTILHCPSNSQAKGSVSIDKAMNELSFDSSRFLYKKISGKPHYEITEEKKKSVFYIDQFNPAVGGYGVSALESVFNQNITFSTINNINDLVYELLSGCPPVTCRTVVFNPIIHLGETQEQMCSVLKDNIKNTNEEQMIKHIENTADWLNKHYSPEAIIKRFKNL